MPKKNARLLWLGLAVVLLFAGYFMLTFNRLVNEEEAVNRTWSEMQNAYMRRYDLVPSLVSVVKGTASYEQTILAELAAARSKAASFQFSEKDLSATNNQQQAAAEAALSASMKKCLLVVENYPDIKGTKSFLYLQSQLEGTERRIKVARKDFNEAIQMYNGACRKFPSSVVAGIAGFKVKEGFENSDGAQAKEVLF